MGTMSDYPYCITPQQTVRRGGFRPRASRLPPANLFAQLAVVSFEGDSSQRQRHRARVLHAADALRVRARGPMRGLGPGVHESRRRGDGPPRSATRARSDSFQCGAVFVRAAGRLCPGKGGACSGLGPGAHQGGAPGSRKTTSVSRVLDSNLFPCR